MTSTATLAKPFFRTGNLRHDLDAQAVAAQVDKKLAEYQVKRIEWRTRAEENLRDYEKPLAAGEKSRWSGKPKDPAYVDPMMDEWCAKERNYYAKVRVIELPQATKRSKKRFVLVYGDQPDAEVIDGTGPFETLERAQAWFLNGGR